jgi:hypothetical protein
MVAGVSLTESASLAFDSNPCAIISKPSPICRSPPSRSFACRSGAATDQQQLIQDYAVLRGEAGVDQCVPVANRLPGRYGAGGVINSLEHPGLNRCLDVGLEGYGATSATE